MADKPFAIIGVNSDRDLDSIRKVTKEKSITWRSFWNGEEGTRGPISTKWSVSGWPTTYLIDKDGVIRYKNVRGEALDKAIEELMSEMGETVELVGIDHEAEDKAALAAAKESADNQVSTEASEGTKEGGEKEKEAESADAESAKTDSDADAKSEEATAKPEEVAAKSEKAPAKEAAEKKSEEKVEAKAAAESTDETAESKPAASESEEKKPDAEAATKEKPADK